MPEPELLPARPVASTVEADPDVREAARALAGFETTHEDPRYARLLARHGPRVDKAWNRLESDFGTPMREWAQTNLDSATGTVFYPFSGADFFTLHRFYPAATRYVMVAMQPARRPLELEGLRAASLREELDAYARMARGLSSRGFFVTSDMNATLRGHGITGQLMLTAEREGFDVLAVHPIVLADDGQVTIDRSDRPRFMSVRLHLRRRHDGADVTLDYVRANLSDNGIAETPGLRPFLEDVTRSPVVCKAASHLMQQGNFSAIRDLLLENAQSIVQDESAIAYEDLAEHFEVALYGNFVRVNELFHDDSQHALAEAYAAGPSAPLPFVFGYDKGARGSALQVARTRRGSALPSPA